MSEYTLVDYGNQYPKIHSYQNGYLIPVNIQTNQNTNINNISFTSYSAYQVFSLSLGEHELNKAFGELKDLYPEDYRNAAFYQIRQKRDKLIAETDWLITKAKENNEEVAQELKDYRQALRDLPNTYISASDVVFPEI
jgi:hypothetical protein